MPGSRGPDGNTVRCEYSVWGRRGPPDVALYWQAGLLPQSRKLQQPPAYPTHPQPSPRRRLFQLMGRA